MSDRFDVLIIGGGIAGASCGYYLAREGLAVAVLEREEQPGYHSTGRSAALFTETYGPPVIRKLATASRGFVEQPPDGFAEHPLLTPRGLLIIGTDDDAPKVEAALQDGAANGAEMQRLDAAAIAAAVPILRPGLYTLGALERDAADIDVHALHQGFLRGLKQAGGVVLTRAEVDTLTRTDGTWTVVTRQGATLHAPTIVNAAGAWADEVAAAAGVAPIGLQPKRRTGIMLDLPADYDVRDWPMAADAADTFYIKPDAGRLMLSPADAEPVPPQDVQPEDLDVAIAVDRFMTATTITVERPGETWAGLRSFVVDGDPVAGWAADADGFFWLAGQGGYGIATAPGLARYASALVRGRPLDDDLQALGLTAETLAPRRSV